MLLNNDGGLIMSEWMLVLLTAVYVIATFFIYRNNSRFLEATKEQINEMKRQFDTHNRPYIIVELVFEGRLFYGLRFSNHGKRNATRAIIQLSQEFIDSLPEQKFKDLLELQKERECVIGIGKHYDLFFGTNEYREKADKPSITGIVTYFDNERQFDEGFSIDIESYATFFSLETHEEKFMKEMKYNQMN